MGETRRRRGAPRRYWLGAALEGSAWGEEVEVGEVALHQSYSLHFFRSLSLLSLRAVAPASGGLLKLSQSPRSCCRLSIVPAFTPLRG